MGPSATAVVAEVVFTTPGCRPPTLIPTSSWWTSTQMPCRRSSVALPRALHTVVMAALTPNPQVRAQGPHEKAQMWDWGPYLPWQKVLHSPPRPDDPVDLPPVRGPPRLQSGSPARLPPGPLCQPVKASRSKMHSPSLAALTWASSTYELLATMRPRRISSKAHAMTFTASSWLGWGTASLPSTSRRTLLSGWDRDWRQSWTGWDCHGMPQRTGRGRWGTGAALRSRFASPYWTTRATCSSTS
mmetsp:Transcript_112526/g.195417  ORF Transcript_112526/g.195417 Transcript_112526/m.195417 type:complete len:243 (+) Transcript_112526:1229-1957(+)